MSNHDTATDRRTTPLGDGESKRGGVTRCWICQQPLDPVEVVRVRDEPIHPDCGFDGPRYLDD